MRIILCDQNIDEIKKYAFVLEKNLDMLSQETSIETVDSGEKLLFEFSDEPDDADLIVINTEFEGKMKGMDAIKQLRDIGYSGEVIFLTNDEGSVFDSFKVRPADYLIKSKVSAREFFYSVKNAAEYARKRKREMLTFSCAGEIRNIAVEDILYFEIVQRIVEVHYLNEVFEFYSTMPRLENLLYGKDFVRTHRAFLVNRSHISYVMGEELIMDNDETVPLSPKYAKGLKKKQNENEE